MKLLKTVSSVCLVIALSAALGGCVVVPVPFGYGGHYHHDYRR